MQRTNGRQKDVSTDDNDPDPCEDQLHCEHPPERGSFVPEYDDGELIGLAWVCECGVIVDWVDDIPDMRQSGYSQCDHESKTAIHVTVTECCEDCGKWTQREIQQERPGK